MKKSSLIPFFLTLILAAGLFSPCAAAAEPPELTAPSALLVDVTYEGEILYERNAHERRYPASITKVMTGLLVLEAVDRGEVSLDQIVTVSDNVNQGIVWGATNAEIKPGEILSLGDLLRCALIPSANDACNVLAEVTAGSIEAFVERMNARAEELGCEDTHYTNPHGLHNDDHYTTAWDTYLICREAMNHATFREIVSARSYVVPPTNLHTARTLHDTNSLVSTWNRRGYYYQYATGIKSGYTEEAGRCLASSATKGDRSLIAVVMGCQRVPGSTESAGFLEFSESKTLLEWGFSQFSRRSILTSTDLMGDLPVTLSKTEFVAAQPAGSLEATLPNDLDLSTFSYDIQWENEQVEAPVKKGQVLGSVTVSYEGRTYGTLELVAVAGAERSPLRFYLDRIQKFLAQTWVRIILIVLLVLLVILVLWRVFVRKSRRRYTSRYPRNRNNYRGRKR